MQYEDSREYAKFSEPSSGLAAGLVSALVLGVIIGGVIGRTLKWSGIELEKQVNLVSGEIENIERLMELRMKGIVKIEEGKVVEVGYGGKETKTKINKKAKATKVKPKKKLENRPKEKKKIKKKVRTGETVYRTVMNP
jgi:hypothetical protein